MNDLDALLPPEVALTRIGLVAFFRLLDDLDRRARRAPGLYFGDGIVKDTWFNDGPFKAGLGNLTMYSKRFLGREAAGDMRMVYLICLARYGPWPERQQLVNGLPIGIRDAQIADRWYEALILLLDSGIWRWGDLLEPWQITAHKYRYVLVVHRQRHRDLNWQVFA